MTVFDEDGKEIGILTDVKYNYELPNYFKRIEANNPAFEFEMKNHFLSIGEIKRILREGKKEAEVKEVKNTTFSFTNKFELRCEKCNSIVSVVKQKGRLSTGVDVLIVEKCDC